MNKYCIICKTDKNISNFVKTRNECISCRQKVNDEDKVDIVKERKTCSKFKQGPFIYVFESFGRYKIGKVDKIDNLNVRLASHRCMDPNLIIKYIIYTPQYDLLEKCILLRFENKLIDLNHEFVDDLLLEDLYDGIKCIISSCGIQATFEEQQEIDKYNEKIQ